MNLRLYLFQARRWLLFAVIPAALVVVGTYLYERHLPKQFESSALLYVQVSSSDSSNPGGTDVYTSTALIPTYAQIITAPFLASKVDHDMAARYPGYRIEAHSLSAQGLGSAPSAPINTQLMSVKVTDTNPVRAADAANAVGKAFIAQISKIQKQRFKGGAQAVKRQLAVESANIELVSQRIQNYKGNSSGLNNLKAQLSAYESIYQTLLSADQQYNLGKNTALNGVKLISPAIVPTSAIGPHPVQIAALAGFVVLLLCLGLIFLYDYVDDTPRTPEEIEKLVGSPILGTVEAFRAGKRLVSTTSGSAALAEAYRVIRTNIRYTDIDQPPRAIVVTSPSPGEGKSTTASNLANVVAEGGRTVALIDADLRRPTLHRIFEVDRLTGLTNLLISPAALAGRLAESTTVPNLQLITSGPTPPRPADLLESRRMQDIIRHMRSQNDMVIIDSPPILAVTDAAILSTFTDGVVLVVDPAKSKRRDLKRAREAIEAVGGRTLGIVINRLNKRGSSYYYYYYRHNYGQTDKNQYLAPTEAEGAAKPVELSAPLSTAAEDVHGS